MDAVTDDIVSVLRPYVPEISIDDLAEIIESIAPVHRTRRRMFIAISKRPGILTGADPNVPTTVQKLTVALSEAGGAAIVVPGCEQCERKISLPHRAPRGGRHCSRCEKTTERDPALAADNDDPSIKTSMANTSAGRAGDKIQGPLDYAVGATRQCL